MEVKIRNGTLGYNFCCIVPISVMHTVEFVHIWMTWHSTYVYMYFSYYCCLISESLCKYNMKKTRYLLYSFHFTIRKRICIAYRFSNNPCVAHEFSWMIFSFTALAYLQYSIMLFQTSLGLIEYFPKYDFWLNENSLSFWALGISSFLLFSLMMFLWVVSLVALPPSLSLRNLPVVCHLLMLILVILLYVYTWARGVPISNRWSPV